MIILPSIFVNIKMMMRKKSFVLYIICIVLLAYVIVCRYSLPAADFYALEVYPRISLVLSFISSLVPFSIQEFIVTVIIIIGLFLLTRIRKWGFKRFAKYELLLLLSTYVWFYMSWANNYSRSSIFYRTETAPRSYNEAEFLAFVGDYVDSINAAWTSDTISDISEIELEIKKAYSEVPNKYGLSKPRSWHHPKEMLYRPLYSAVGVAGFMSPLLSESCVNSDILAIDVPGVYTHEYAHLLGVSSEAEANWWAYTICTASQTPAVKYSGYWEVLPYIMNNAQRIMSEDEFSELFNRLRPEIIEDISRSNKRREELRWPMLDKVRGWMYDLFLKSNKIPSGKQNYSEVIMLIMTFSYSANNQ